MSETPGSAPCCLGSTHHMFPEFKGCALEVLNFWTQCPFSSSSRAHSCTRRRLQVTQSVPGVWSCCTEHVSPSLDFLGPQFTVTQTFLPQSVPQQGLPSPVLTSSTTSAGQGGWAVWFSIPGHSIAGTSPWEQLHGHRYICVHCFHSRKENEACSFKLKLKKYYIHIYFYINVWCVFGFSCNTETLPCSVSQMSLSHKELSPSGLTSKIKRRV